MALSKLAVRRLTKLADYMDKLKPTPKAGFAIDAAYVSKRGCGFVACAGGWATKIPAFRKAGLLTVHHSSDLANFFHISDDDAHDLFNVRCDMAAETTPQQWAKLCRTFIRENA